MQLLFTLTYIFYFIYHNRWSNVFIGDKKIDVSNLTGRKSESNDKNMQAWNEAHKLFMDKVANREKVEVDCEDT